MTPPREGPPRPGTSRPAIAPDVEAFAEAFADRIAARVKRETTAPVKEAALEAALERSSDRRRGQLHDWLRFTLSAAGLLAVILGAWNNLRDEVAKRPTAEGLERQVEPLRSNARELDAEQRAQRDLIIEIQGSLKRIDEKLGELKPTKPARR